MTWLRRMGEVVSGLLMLLPFFIACLSVREGSLGLAAGSVAAVFAVVAVLPFTRGYERIWVFLIAALAVIPWNVTAAVWWLRKTEYEITLFPAQIARGMLIYLILFCVEEMIAACFGRIIWRKQKVLVDAKIHDRTE